MVAPLESRNADFELGKKDCHLLNCFIEQRHPQRLIARKRPGFYSYSLNYAPSLFSQGISYFNDRLYAISNNTLYRLGAAQSGYTTGSAWTNMGNATFTARASFAYCVFKGRMWIFGGLTAAAYQNDVWSSSDGVNWAQVALSAPWTPRINMEVTVLNDVLYMTGGADSGGNFLNDVWATEDGVNWVQKTASAQFTARSGISFIAFNNLLWVIGGADSGGLLRQVWSSADGITWSQQTATPGWAARTLTAVAVFNNKIWLVGGDIAGGLYANDVWSSPDGITWTQATAAAFASGRRLLDLVVYDGKLWALSGYNGGFLSTVHYSSDGVTWTQATAAPGWAARSSAGIFVFQSPASISSTRPATIWLVSGLTGAGSDSQIWLSNLNGSTATAWVIGTTGPNTDKFNFVNVNYGQYLFFKNGYDAWILDGNTLLKVTDSNYPSRTVPGVVNLNSTVYVMDADGTIYGCNLQDPKKWDALNFITAEYQPDKGVGLIMNSNYVLAFKEFTTEFFYNAGNADGSPLSPVINATTLIGCVDARTIAVVQDNPVFMGRSFNSSERAIYMIVGTEPKMISTPQINRLFEDLDFSVGFLGSAALIVGGRAFYVISTSYYQQSIVYDFTQKEWYLWKWGPTNGYFPIKDFCTDGLKTYVQDNAAANIYYFTKDSKADFFSPITCRIQTPITDFGMMARKFNAYVDIVADRGTGNPNNITLEVSDDDYATWSTAVTVNINNERPRASRMGSFTRRAYRLTHTSASEDFGGEALEVGIDLGVT